MLNIGLVVGTVGKPRKPITPGVAAFVSVFGVLHVLAYAYLTTQV